MISNTFLTNNYLSACKNCPELAQDAPLGSPELYLTPIKETDRYQVFASISGSLYGKKKGDDQLFGIPHIEEIISIIRKKAFVQFGQMNDLKLDVHMRTIISKLYCYSGCAALTFSEMWLVFYMAAIYKKQWNFGREEWETI